MPLFLNPIIKERREVGQMIPEVDFDKCTYCGRCAEVGQYNAIAKDDSESMEAAKRLGDRILDLYRKLKVDGQPVK